MLDLEQSAVVIVVGRSLSDDSGVFLDVELDVTTSMRRAVGRIQGRVSMMRLLCLANYVVRAGLILKQYMRKSYLFE